MTDVLTCHDLGISDARDAIQDWLNSWWETRKTGGRIGETELREQVDAFFDSNPEYSDYRVYLRPQYQMSSWKGHYWTDECGPGCAPACYEGKVKGVKVDIVDWEEAAALAGYESRTERQEWSYTKLHSDIDIAADHLPKPPPMPRIRIV